MRKRKFYAWDCTLPKSMQDNREPPWSRGHVIWAKSAREATDKLREAGVKDRLFSSYPTLYQVLKNKVIEYRYAWHGWVMVGDKEIPVETRFYYVAGDRKNRDPWGIIYDLHHSRTAGWKLIRQEIEGAIRVRERRKSPTEYVRIPYPRKPEKPIIKLPVEWITGSYINMMGYASFEHKNVKGLIEVDESLKWVFVNKTKTDVYQRELDYLKSNDGFFSFASMGLDALTIKEMALSDGRVWKVNEGWVN